jgi:penicillin-binding protein 2
LSIDMQLQQVAEEALGNRRGAVVAIEPKTGEVLAFVSRPSFDPNLFIDGIDQTNWDLLNNDPDRPLLNRPLRGTYPPGSTFKPFMSLAALQTGKRTPEQAIRDPGFYVFGNHRFRDDKEGGHGMVDMVKSIIVSCDTYYYLLATDMGIELLSRSIGAFGFGSLTNIDLEGEAAGVLPSPAWKQQRFKKAAQQKWYAGETVSIGIGQGYNSYTPLQLAYATAALANDGVAMKPRLVRYVEDVKSGARAATLGPPQADWKIRPDHMATIRAGMVGVNIEGTGSGVFRGAGYTSAGKTGTSQVIAMKQNEKYDEKKVKERFRDHSLYVAFAPVEEPKIAVAIIVENGGFGSRSAAPIARQLFDFHLLGKRPDAKPAPVAAPSPGEEREPELDREIVRDPAFLPDDVNGEAAITPGAIK